jgi:hypothetical protein
MKERWLLAEIETWEATPVEGAFAILRLTRALFLRHSGRNGKAFPGWLRGRP